MKKIWNINIKTLFLLIIVIVLASGVTYAATTYIAASNQVSYDNANSGLTATNVQGALDELYNTCINSY